MNATGIQSRAGETAMRFTPLKGDFLGVKEKGVKRLLGQIEQYEESILCFAGGTDAVGM